MQLLRFILKFLSIALASGGLNVNIRIGELFITVYQNCSFRTLFYQLKPANDD